MKPFALSAASSYRIVRDSARRSAGHFAEWQWRQLSVLQYGIQLRYRRCAEPVQLCQSGVDLSTVRLDRAQIALGWQEIAEVGIFEMPRQVAIGETKLAIRKLRQLRGQRSDRCSDLGCVRLAGEPCFVGGEHLAHPIDDVVTVVAGRHSGGNHFLRFELRRE